MMGLQGLKREKKDASTAKAAGGKKSIKEPEEVDMTDLGDDV